MTALQQLNDFAQGVIDTPPKPLRVLYDDVATGSFDGQWVQMDGVVRSFIQQAEGNVLVIAAYQLD